MAVRIRALDCTLVGKHMCSREGVLGSNPTTPIFFPNAFVARRTPSHLGHMDRVAATMPSQAHAGAAQEAPDIGQWEGQDVPLVRPSSCNVKGGIPSSRRYLPTYLARRQLLRNAPLKEHHSRYITLLFKGTYSVIGFYEVMRMFLVSLMHFLR